MVHHSPTRVKRIPFGIEIWRLLFLKKTPLSWGVDGNMQMRGVWSPFGIEIERMEILGVTAYDGNKRLLFLSQNVSHHKPLESL